MLRRNANVECQEDGRRLGSCGPPQGDVHFDTHQDQIEDDDQHHLPLESEQDLLSSGAGAEDRGVRDLVRHLAHEVLYI